jgi:hypothetical protein
MSIEIVGSNEEKIKLITENKIESIIKNQEIAYNLYKSKYLNKCNNNSSNIKTQSHLLKQLIKTFYKYNNNKNLDSNISNFIIYINKINTNDNIIQYINNFLIQHNILNNLENGIKKNLKKIFEKKYNKDIEDIQLHNNYYVDLIYTIKIIEENSKISNKNNNEIKQIINEIYNELKKLNIELKNLNIMKLKIYKNAIELNININSCQFINKLIDNIDILLKNTNNIKTNILKIESIINILTEKIYKLYLLI